MGTLPMPFNNPSTYAGHSGVDFGQPRGTAIRASGPGVVLRTSYNETGGYWTVIRYDAYPSDEVGYAHQDEPVTEVRAGQRVALGTVIGDVGSLGKRSTGPHLHVEVLNRPGYANAIGIFDKSLVVGQATTGGTVTGNWPARAKYGEAWVESAQTKLTHLGLYTGLIDGKDGPDTQAGTRTLQAAGGLDKDGIFGPDTNKLADLILNGRNATSRPTKDIQTALNKAGFDPGPIDNKWGGRTSFAEYRWQKKVGLTADAIHGPASDAKMFPTAPAPAPVTLPARVAREVTYPGAVRAWTPPYAYRVKDGKENVRPGGKITAVALHHTGSTADQEAFFTSRNDRVSCPNVYINEKAELIELVPYHLQPSSTGGANDYTVAIEVENVSGAPEWGISDAQHEAVAKFVAWLSQQTSLGGVPVNVPLDRQHVMGHREFPTTTNGTICPGPSMDLDRIVHRALELVTPTPAPGTVVIAKTDLMALRTELETAGKTLGAAAARITGWLS